MQRVQGVAERFPNRMRISSRNSGSRKISSAIDSAIRSAVRLTVDSTAPAVCRQSDGEQGIARRLLLFLFPQLRFTALMMALPSRFHFGGELLLPPFLPSPQGSDVLRGFGMTLAKDSVTEKQPLGIDSRHGSIFSGHL